MIKHHIAQLNIAKMKYSIDSPEFSGFVDKLNEVNALADKSPGFIWRLQTEQGDATGIDFFGADMLVNMSVWESIETLHSYVYRSMHNKVLAQRKQWFEPMQQAYSVLWWTPAGAIPTIEDAGERLDELRRTGPNPNAFTFKQVFDTELD
jgi:hypothetical protein